MNFYQYKSDYNKYQLISVYKKLINETKLEITQVYKGEEYTGNFEKMGLELDNILSL